MRYWILIFATMTMLFSVSITQVNAQGGESSGGGLITYSTDQPVTVITSGDGLTYFIVGDLPEEAVVEDGIDFGQIDPKPTPRPLPPDHPLPSPKPTPCWGPFCPHDAGEELIYPTQDFGDSLTIIQME